MTSDLAQGACQAIVDAATLAGCLAEAGDPRAARRAYQQRRWRNAAATTLLGRNSGTMGQWDGCIACAPRDALMPVMPLPLQLRQIDVILGGARKANTARAARSLHADCAPERAAREISVTSGCRTDRCGRDAGKVWFVMPPSPGVSQAGKPAGAACRRDISAGPESPTRVHESTGPEFFPALAPSEPSLALPGPVTVTVSAATLSPGEHLLHAIAARLLAAAPAVPPVPGSAGPRQGPGRSPLPASGSVASSRRCGHGGP